MFQASRSVVHINQATKTFALGNYQCPESLKLDQNDVRFLPQRDNCVSEHPERVARCPRYSLVHQVMWHVLFIGSTPIWHLDHLHPPSRTELLVFAWKFSNVVLLMSGIANKLFQLE